MHNAVILGICLFLIGCNRQNNSVSQPVSDQKLDEAVELITDSIQSTFKTNTATGVGSDTPQPLAPASSVDLGGRVYDLTGKSIDSGKTTFDENGQPAKSQFPDGSIIQYAGGLPIKLILPSGQITAYFYDEKGRLLKTVFSNGEFEAFGYDDKGVKNLHRTRDGKTVVPIE